MRVTLQSPPFPELPFAWLASIGNVRLGVHLQDGWCVDTRGQTKFLSNPDDMMPLLPLLEISKAQFYGHLCRIAETRMELMQVAKSFPAIFLLRFAFDESVSDYWPLKALDWLDAGLAADPDIRKSLRTLLRQRWVTQQLKQRVGKIVKRSEGR